MTVPIGDPITCPLCEHHLYDLLAFVHHLDDAHALEGRMFSCCEESKSKSSVWMAEHLWNAGVEQHLTIALLAGRLRA